MGDTMLSPYWGSSVTIYLVIDGRLSPKHSFAFEKPPVFTESEAKKRKFHSLRFAVFRNRVIRRHS